MGNAHCIVQNKKKGDGKIMEKQENVDEIINSAMKNLKDIIDSNTIIGKTIKIDEVSLIPVSKVNVGFVAGGGESSSKTKQKNLPFLGGSGAGFSVVPVGVITITKNNVNFLQVDRIDAVSELMKTANSFISNLVKENKDEKTGK